ncbi:MAG TPA: PDC sensor domain-containing protein [Thermoanaerobaculia bacterium]|nr:PDC sensor domain-containing protein [Thermoanaerobaculia bacterium]
MASDPDRPDRRWGSRLLYLGVFLLAVLVALAALSIYGEWQQRIGQSRSEAIFQLVQGKTPARPTETPGATAWLNLELRRYRERIPDPEKARLYGEVAEWQDTRSVPPFLAPVRDLLASPLRRPAVPPNPVLHPSADLGEPAMPSTLRTQSFLELDGHWLAATRRTALDARDLSDLSNPSNRFLALAAPHLVALSEELPRVLREHPLPAFPGARPPRVIRIYALSEDGTLVSLSLAQSRRAVLEEGREFRGSPERPTFVSNEFYFRFDFARPESQTFYSGLYLDLGGQGLVATITAPLRDPALGEHGLAGADLAFDIDWEAFARRIDPPMIAAVVHLAEPPSRSRPWADLASAFSRRRPAALHRAVTALAAQRPGEEGAAESVPYVLHGVVEGQGAVAAFQAAATTWLVVLFPKTQSHWPLIPVLLSAVMLIALLWGFELNRRRAERAQEKAEAAFQEKQNLLSTMQVPLVVVDPNTDEVVFGNQAAEKLGVRAGARIGDMVSPDPKARAHYERMQVANPNPRRAYGVPVRVRGEDGLEEERYAIVRSVAVTAPIEALHADERHRLGILFLVEPEADLALLTGELADETRQDERRKLAGLLSHGVDTLIRVLAYSLRARSGAASSPELVSWLAEYVDRRLRTTAWLLDHWEAEPPLPPDSSIEAPQARATLERLAGVFALAANAPDAADLRARLHWDNGVLSERPDPQAPVFKSEIDWPEDYWFACPVRGGFGFFLGEVLINAIRHGRPGSTPELRIILDRVRRELRCEVENELPAEPREREEETYGGKSILRQLARLFEWRDLRFERRERTYLVSWRVRLSERGDPRKPD